MTTETKSKLIHGLSDFHMAILQKDTKTGVTYGKVQPVDGAVSVSGDPQADENKKWADNQVHTILDSFESLDVTMAAIDIPEAFQAEMFGEKVVNGVIFSNRDDITKEVALGFRARIRNGGYRYYWLLKGKPKVMGIDHETDQGTIESKDAQLNLTFTPLIFNGQWRARLSSEIVTLGDWFKEVVYSEEQAKALPGETTQEPDPEQTP